MQILLKNNLFSNTILLNKNEFKNLYNLKYMAKTLRINQQNDDRIKIKLMNNYDNRDYIGLS